MTNRFGSWGRTLCLALACVAAACSLDTNEPAIDTSQSNLDPEVLSITLRVPSGASFLDTTVGAATRVRIGDRAQVRGGVFGADGDVEIGKEAKLSSALVTAVGDVELGKQARIEGDVRATGKVRRAPGSSVHGRLEAPANIDVSTQSWSVTASPTSLGDVVVARGVTRDLSPGTYDELIAASGATVVLHSGVYVVSKALFFRGSELELDDGAGPVQLYVRDESYFRAATRSTTASEPKLLVSHLGSKELIVRPPFAGAVVAPNASVSLERCDDKRDDDCERDHWKR
ncbi:MAG: polymer-forming cytoskeletal protein [Labilithrix sp.]|nr:polymer-forming cytoskeletal protein [Labilithrix sp.]MCW5816115.1 polymer-forming cytoskeletal protein [Labilithrix sp.]